MLHGKGNKIGRRKRRFLFKNAWIKEEECRKIVENAWTGLVNDNTVEGIQIAFDDCTTHLKASNKFSLRALLLSFD